MTKNIYEYGNNTSYSQKQLNKGVRAEIEDKHSSNMFFTEKIAKDHLKGNKDYYQYSGGSEAEYLVSTSNKKKFCDSM